MILTKEFLGDSDSCLEGYRFGLENNLINNDYDEAIKFCLENGHQDFADWLIEQKTTEKYVKALSLNDRCHRVPLRVRRKLENSLLLWRRWQPPADG